MLSPYILGVKSGRFYRILPKSENRPDMVVSSLSPTKPTSRRQKQTDQFPAFWAVLSLSVVVVVRFEREVRESGAQI